MDEEENNDFFDTATETNEVEEINNPKEKEKTKRTHPVWKFFDLKTIVNQNTKKKQVVVSCKTGSCKWKNTFSDCASSTVAKNHLKESHPRFFEENKAEFESFKKKLEETGKAGFDENKNLVQTKIQVQLGEKLSLLNTVAKYSTDSTKSQLIRAAFVKLLSLPSGSIGLFTTDHFHNLIKVIDPKVALPKNYDDIKSLLFETFSKAKKILITKIKNSESKLSLVLDGWTDKSMVNSYLGASVQFIHDSKMCSGFLTLKKLNSRHTGAELRIAINQILDDFDISEDKIFKYVTDNAANIRSAVKGVESNDSESEMSDEEGDAPETPDNNFIENSNAPETTSDIAFENLPNSFGCIVHSVHLVFGKLIKTLLEEEPHKTIFSNVKKIITHFNKSHESKRALQEISKNVLIKFCPTRWSDWIYSIERFVQLYDKVKTVLERKKSKLSLPSKNDVKFLERFVKIFLPVVKDIIIPLQSQSEPTCAKVYPLICDTIEKFENMKVFKNPDQTNPIIEKLRLIFLNEFKRRFAFVHDKSNANFDRTFILSTFLHPSLAFALSDSDIVFCSGELKKNVRISKNTQPSSSGNVGNTQPSFSGNAGNTQQSSSGNAGDDDETGSPITRMKNRKRQRISVDRIIGEDQAFQDLLACYLKHIDILEGSDSVDVLKFWNSDQRFEPFKEFALSLLAVPASSAMQERIFSQASLATENRKNRKSPELLNAQLFVNINC